MIGQVVGAVVRAVLQALGGGLVTQGLLDSDDLAKAIGAIICLGTVGWSVWQKSRKRTVPGGEWNPRAEVRRAEVPGTEKRVPRSSTRRMDGYVQLSALVAAGVWACGFLVIFWLGVVGVRQDAGRSDQDGRGARSGWRVERFPDVTETVDLTGRAPVIAWRVPMDERGFVVRVVDSLGLWGDVGRDKSGAACYAVGVQGRAEF